MSDTVKDTLKEKISAASDELNVGSDELTKVLKYHGIINANETPLDNERSSRPSGDDVQWLVQEVLTMSNERMDRICEKTSDVTAEVQRKINVLEESFQKNKDAISEVRLGIATDIANLQVDETSIKESFAKDC